MSDLITELGDRVIAGTDGTHINGADVAPNHGLPGLPLKAGQVLRVTPDSAKAADPLPVYLLRVPGVDAAAVFRRDLTVRCGIYPADDVVQLALRSAAARLRDADDAAFVDAVIAAATMSAEDALRLRAIESDVARADPAYRQIIADRTYIQAMMPFIALQHYLVGWENGPGDFVRKNGLTAADTVSAIASDHRRELGMEALQLTGVTEQLAKN